MAKLRAKNLNFVGAEKKKSGEANCKQRIRSVLYLLPLALAIFLLHGYSHQIEKNVRQAKQIQELEAYLGSEAVVSVRERLKGLEEELKKLNYYEQEVDAAENKMTQSVMPDAEDIAVIERATGSEVRIIWDAKAPVRYEGGVLSFEAETLRPREASAYVDRLTATNRFSKATHTGIKKEEGEDGNGMVYRFRVSCLLAASREEAQP